MSVGYIPLTQGFIAMVDFEDLEYLQQWSWCVNRRRELVYAVRKKRVAVGKWVTVQLHHEALGLMGPRPRGYVVDHINHNTLDCRKSNLRVCTIGENSYNRRPNRRRKTSKYRGVSWDKDNRRWRAQVQQKGSNRWLGYFDNEYDAVGAYNAKAGELYGCFAFINIWEGPTLKTDLEKVLRVYHFSDCLTHMFQDKKDRRGY